MYVMKCSADDDMQLTRCSADDAKRQGAIDLRMMLQKLYVGNWEQ